MISDGRGIASDLEADVCIVGAGPAGITFAMELAGAGLKIVLLESGGESHDAETQSLYSGPNIGIQYDPLERSRSRLLGGSSNCWGGWCKPLDTIDFDERAWMPGSGWPFAQTELNSYYSRAHKYLELGAYDYSEDAWAIEMKKRALATFPLSNSNIANQIVQFSPPVRFGKAYRDQIEKFNNVNLLLWSNVVEIDNSRQSGSISVQVQTLSGNRFKINARSVVLAAGGIENARILLLSRGSRNHGLGNEHDLVGRYFMDHPRVRSTTFRVANARLHRRLYDSRMAKTRHRSGRNPNKVAAFLSPTAKAQRELGLPNSRSYLVGHYAFDDSNSFKAVTALRSHLINRRRFGQTSGSDTRSLLTNVLSGMLTAPQGVFGVLDQALNPPIASRRFTLETIIEPIPNPDSRVSLSDERDRLGINRASLNWQLTEQDLVNIKSTTRIVTSEIVNQNIGKIDRRSHNGWDGAITGCWHHMGTTRMHANSRKGVVNTNSELHGAKHIFCLGSSVFPTAGNDCPTLTLVALAIRLADWFKKDLNQVLLPA